MPLYLLKEPNINSPSLSIVPLLPHKQATLQNIGVFRFLGLHSPLRHWEAVEGEDVSLLYPAAGDRVVGTICVDA